MIKKQFKICRDGLMWRDIDREVIILDIENDSYYSLNETGTLVWKMLEKGINVEGIFAALAKEYALSLKNAEKDVNSIIEKLKEEKLITSK